MARHQASMTQYNKLVCVLESPADVNDNIPLNQLINQLEKVDPSAYNNIILSQRHTDKTVLPLLWKIDSDVPDHLICDTMRLTQILLNLCSNAVKVGKLIIYSRKKKS
jgi:signal transduction histidine kinase